MKSSVKYSTLQKFIRSTRQACTKGILHNNAHDEKFTSLAAAPGGFSLILAAPDYEKKGRGLRPVRNRIQRLSTYAQMNRFLPCSECWLLNITTPLHPLISKNPPPPFRTMHRIFVDFLMLLSHSVTQKCPIREPTDSWGWN